MYYLLNERTNADKRIVTDQHEHVLRHLRESDPGWDADRIIKWMWGYTEKAESLVDLIKPGDIIKVDSGLYEVLEGNKIFIPDLGYSLVKYNRIKAIYKLNISGAYACVWEGDYLE